MSKALIVDDDAQVLAFVKQLTETAGYEVLTSDNFTRAREYIQRHDFSIVVADVRLGDFNGIQLGILAKNAWPDVRIVIMSGWDWTFAKLWLLRKLRGTAREVAGDCCESCGSRRRLIHTCVFGAAPVVVLELAVLTVLGDLPDRQ